MANIHDIEKFRFLCHKILPLVYDESLSYYELLCKMNKKLGEVIDQINAHTGEILDFETWVTREIETMEGIVNTVEGDMNKLYNPDDYTDMHTDFGKFVARVEILMAEFEASLYNPQNPDDEDTALGRIKAEMQAQYDEFVRTDGGIVQTLGLETDKIISQKVSTETFAHGEDLEDIALFQLPEITGENLYTGGDICKNVVANQYNQYESKT